MPGSTGTVVLGLEVSESEEDLGGVSRQKSTCRNSAQSAEELPVTASRAGPGGRARAAAQLTFHVQF